MLVRVLYMIPNIYGIGPGAFNQVPTLVSQARNLLQSSFVQSGKDPKTVNSKALNPPTLTHQSETLYPKPLNP